MSDIISHDDAIGRQERAQDIVCGRHLAGLRSILDGVGDAKVDGALPPCGHWTLAPAIAGASDTGRDGHIRLARFLPDVGLPRRMWAASAVDFHMPIVAGMPVERISTIVSIKVKSGSTGSLVFVEVNHVYRSEGRELVHETQTIVYREANAAGRPASAFEYTTSDWPMRRTFSTDPVTLFRYSALTYNGHRIHYDEPYARDVEGYPGLVVHGPLTATLLADLAARSLGGESLRRFSFRGQNPAFAGETLRLLGRTNGKKIELMALGEDHRLLMTAEAIV